MNIGLIKSYIWWAIILVGVIVGPVDLPATERPSNRVIIIIDSSGSYKSRQNEAIEKSIKLLDDLAKTKVHRWDTGNDRIYLIALDAMPDVIWEGSLRELKAMDRPSWKNRFLARSDYSKCTDVVKAFRLAAQYLEGDPRYVSKYIFAFSDLLHEPPVKSIDKPRSPESVPQSGFPWEAMKDVTVKVFWMPREQKFAWQQAIDSRGLTSAFGLYSESESSLVSVATPPEAKVKLTDADRSADREKLTDKVLGIGLLLGLFVFGFIIIVGVIIGLVFFLKRNRQRRGPQLQMVNPNQVRPIRPIGPGVRSLPRPIKPVPRRPNYPNHYPDHQ